MIAIVDYKTGNLASVKKAFDAIGANTIISDDPALVRSAEKIVLPGVGHFRATEALEQLGLRSAILDSVSNGIPLLGICVGMQWLFAGSEESPATAGAALLPGNCVRFNGNVRCPHVGWNQLEHMRGSRLLAGVVAGSFVYFTHSYYVPESPETIAITHHGPNFSAAVERQNIFGVQFHPEKSGPAGLRILRNFAELPC